MAKKAKKPVTKEISPAKSGFLKFGYVMSIIEIWAAALIVMLLDLALAVCGVTGIIGGISLFIRHLPLQGWLYLGTGFVAAGLVIPVFFALEKIYGVAKDITGMQSEKLKIKTEEAEK